MNVAAQSHTDTSRRTKWEVTDLTCSTAPSRTASLILASFLLSNQTNQANLTVLTLILLRICGTQGEADVCYRACLVNTLWQWSRHKLKCESSLHLSVWYPLSLLICILQQVHQPSALFNACLSDTALNLCCARVFIFPVSRWLIRSQRCSADVTAQRRTGPGHSGTEEAGAAWQ